MFLPIGDVPNPKSTPYVNWLLIGINILREHQALSFLL